jgi:ADP-ribosylglycohydrolase
MQHDFSSRCENAFLGLALGDAYGRPLEFLSGAMAQGVPVRIDDSFMWTDDTHMSLYVAEACLEVDEDDEDAFGDAFGRAFVRWLEDPLMPSTAPGNTCLAGARAFDQGRDWRTSGVSRSDGCGAVMRMGPVSMRFRGDTMDTAARVQALVTHGHPNAEASAVFGCRLLRRVLERGVLEVEDIRGLMEEVDNDDLRAGLEAVLALADTEFDRLPEGEVPTYDGGWRSVSALCLALLAALRWPDDARTAIDRAARIDGDSDSVACVAGLFIGATGAELPADWLAVLPRREEMRQLARELSQG